MADQGGNILGAAGQAGDLKHNHAEPEEQVFAELAIGDRGAQILVRRRNDADINAAHLAAADADDRPVLDHAKQLDLHVETHVADFVEKQRTALRSEEHTSELQSLMRISYAVLCLKKKK